MIAWSIAGSDSGGGAGIQADLKTMHALGAHGCTVIAGLTAQNTQAVTKVAYPSLDMIEAQMDALALDLPAKAIKTGMLGSAEIMRLVARKLANYACFKICDPVMVATSGGVLMEPDALDALRNDLLPQCDLVTPNLKEAEVLANMTIATDEDMAQAARKLLDLGVKAVFIKGGHGHSATFAQDYFYSKQRQFWLTNTRIDTHHTHGTGCTLAAAIAAVIAQGYNLHDALVIAKAFVTQGIRAAKPLGQGHGPVVQGAWPESTADLPWLTPTAAEGRNRLRFAPTTPGKIGFYPIFDRAAWLEKLLPFAVPTVQIRIKDLQGDALEQELIACIRLCKQHGTRLFINDYWQLAVKHGAYGVHLGQEDLQTLSYADLQTIADAGLRLGVSTHCYWEVSRALALQPSYMAIGPIYPTTTKEMVFGPQGIDALKRWSRSLPGPLVAIGGINLERLPQVQATGAEGIAVITAITKAKDPIEATKTWLSLMEN